MKNQGHLIIQLNVYIFMKIGILIVNFIGLKAMEFNAPFNKFSVIS